ncbi:MAG: acyltransferase [Novosphingobium sp.]|nr:acyltransferase [Novosphingobium sp.]
MHREISRKMKFLEWAKSEPLASRMSGNYARDNAFDAIRLIAAITVIFSHSFPISTGSNASEPLYSFSSGQTTFGGTAVAIFFVLSGLFISSSFDNTNSITTFWKKRFLRIFPGLFIACLVCMFVLGPFFTALSLFEYISQHKTWLFIKNAFFLPSDYTLPNVFTSHPQIAVNGSLWSLKFEIACYGLAVAGMSLNKFRTPLIWATWIASFYIARHNPSSEPLTGLMFLVNTGAGLFRFFGAGMLIYLHRDQVRLNRILAISVAILAVATAKTPYFVEALAILAPYPIIVFGYEAPKWFKDLAKRGDVSYGVYIYGWPIQQAVWTVGSGASTHWLINCSISIPLAILLGVISWNMVEKPALKYRWVSRTRR